MRGARWASIPLQLIAISVAMSALLAASMADGMCCVCQGAPIDECISFEIAVPPGEPTPSPITCAQCACSGLGTVRSCSDAVASCAGVADDCDSNACVQTQTGSGFCDSPTPTSTPTNTATATATGTATNTATATSTGTVTQTPTNTPVPRGGACTTPSQCSTGFCVADVCCDTACTSPQERCDLPGQRGICTSTTAPAPAVGWWGLLAVAVFLASIGALTLRRRSVRR